jgi:hypothetical protein
MPICNLATIGKDWHDQAISLPSFANWNPLKNPLRDDLGSVIALV